LSVQGAYGQRFAAGSTTGKGDKQGDLGRVGLAVEVPIFAGGQVRAEINEQRAELAAARQRLRQLRLKIRLEVETALTNIDTYQAQLRGLKSAVDQAREGLRLERLKYELEKGRIVDVLDARAAFLRAETSYYQVLARLKTSQVQLQLAVGEL
jgi:OMF family outer membrane factor